MTGRLAGHTRQRIFRRMLMASGTVVSTPIASNTQPDALRSPAVNLVDTSKASPAPAAALVAAMAASSCSGISTVFISIILQRPVA